MTWWQWALLVAGDALDTLLAELLGPVTRAGAAIRKRVVALRDAVHAANEPDGDDLNVPAQIARLRLEVKRRKALTRGGDGPAPGADASPRPTADNRPTDPRQQRP